MPTRDLSGVRARLEEAVALLPGDPTGPEELADRYEQVAIAILDSEFCDFIPGELQEYLEAVLYAKRLELGLIPFPEPGEE
jgi:hypothetical protein